MTSLSSCECCEWRRGQLSSSPGPGWCYPWDQDTEESPSVTTTLFASYLRILLYNKFDVAKPSDHITTIKLIPPSYSGGPQSVSQLTNNQLTANLGTNFSLPEFYVHYCWLQSMFLFSPGGWCCCSCHLSWIDQSLLIFTTPGSMAVLTTHHLQT